MDRNMMVLINTLTNLAELAREGERGFRAAAGVIKDTRAKIELYNYGQACRNFYVRLEIELRRIGGSPDSTTVRTSPDISWFNLTSTLVDRDTDIEIIAATDRALSAFKRNYEIALSRAMTAELRSIIQDQYNQVVSWKAYVDVLAQNAGLTVSR